MKKPKAPGARSGRRDERQAGRESTRERVPPDTPPLSRVTESHTLSIPDADKRGRGLLVGGLKAGSKEFRERVMEYARSNGLVLPTTFLSFPPAEVEEIWRSINHVWIWGDSRTSRKFSQTRTGEAMEIHQAAMDLAKGAPFGFTDDAETAECYARIYVALREAFHATSTAQSCFVNDMIFPDALYFELRRLAPRITIRSALHDMLEHILGPVLPAAIHGSREEFMECLRRPILYNMLHLHAFAILLERDMVVGTERRFEATMRSRKAMPHQGEVKKVPGKRGPKTKTDVKEDRRMADAWRTRSYRTFKELGREFGLSADQARHAVDRHRKRETRGSTRGMPPD